MKVFITHHKGVNKLKLWKSGSEASAVHSSLLINRGIASEDLDIYEVKDGAKVLHDYKKFTVSDTEIVCLEEYKSYEDTELSISYRHLTPSEISSLSQQLQDDIAFNDSKEAEMEEAVVNGDQAAYDAAKAELKDIPDQLAIRNMEVTLTRPYQTISVEKVVI